MRLPALVLILSLGCLPEMPDSPDLDVGAGLALPDAGRTATPPPPPVDAGPRDVGFGELNLIGLTPNQGPASGGTRVQLRGEGFLPDTIVELGGLAVRDVLVISSRALTFFSPAGQVGPADLRVQNAFGSAELSTAFTYFQPLQPRQLSPRQGPLAGGIELRLSGEGLSEQTVVLLDGRPMLNPRLEGQDLLGTLPAGARPGAVDLRIADAFGHVHWRAAFSYLAPPHIIGISPPRVAPGEMIELLVEGINFCEQPELRIDGVACPELLDDEQGLRCSMRAPEREGLLGVEILCPGGSSQADPGLLVMAEQGDAVLLGVTPAHGRLSGGEQVTLLGRNLPGDELLWDGSPIPVLLPSELGLRVMTPAHELIERIDVSAGAAGLLRQAFSYQDPLILRGLEPLSGPAAGGTTVQLFGDGFCAEPQVLFDGIAQQVVSAERRQITLRTAAHPGGSAPILIRCGERTASRFNGFFFATDLSLVGLSPARGALAGGTEIFVVGRGLARPGIQVFLGGNAVSDMTVISDRLLSAKTPPGAVAGRVDLEVSIEGAQERLVGGFSYYEPGFRYGGSRGGSPQGSINVTVLNSWGQLAPVADAQVVVGGTTREQRIVGQTNANGQVTLSDPSLFGPQTVTVYKDGCDQTRTLVDVDAADLTFWLGCMGEPSPPGGGGGTPPPPLEPLIISGRILGFDKAIFDPGRLGPDERAFAQVHLTQSSPIGSGGWVNGRDFVFEDGGEYRIVLPSGRYTLVAVAGIHNSRTQQVIELTQLGFRRQVTGPPGERLVDQDIHLNYPMDATYGVSLGDRPAPLASMNGADQMRVRVSLDFGGEGYFPLAQEMSRSAFILLRGLPRVPADMLYVSGGLVTGDGGSSPSSTIRVRGNGRLEGGITLGPLLPFAEFIAPPQEGLLIADRMLRWKFGAGPIQPDYVWVDISDGEGRNWELMLRGPQNKLRLPVLPHGTVGLGRPGVYHAQITAVANPRFDFDNFSYLDTWFSSWQALSERSISFRLD